MAWDQYKPPAKPSAEPAWAGGKLPLVGPGVGAGRRLGLGDLMLLIAACSLIFLLVRNFAQTGDTLEGTALAVGVGFLMMAVGLWILIRLNQGTIGGWSLITSGYLTTTLALFHVFALITWPILFGVLIFVRRRYRATEQDALVGVMAIAAGRHMPLAPGVAAFAEQSAGSSRRWIQSLARMLNMGCPLPDAIEMLPRTVSRSSAVLIRVGSGVNALAPALRAAVDLRDRRFSLMQVIGGRLAYLGWMLLVGQSIVGFLIYFITPKFEAIFKDFGIELPGVTKFVIRASHLMADYGGLGFLLELVIGAYILLEISGRSLGFASPIALVSRRRHASLILRALSLAVDAGQSLTPTLATLAETYPSSPIRRRLVNACLDMANGTPWIDALRKRGLLTRAEGGVLDAASRAGNLGWALRELATISERRWISRVEVWSQVAFFVALLGAGALVLVVALAYFVPLIQMIARLGG